MTISLYDITVEAFTPMLRTLSTLLDKGAEHAKAKGFDPAVLVNARLAPDMFPLSRQVQIACDQAKNAAARLRGQEPPVFPDDETTIDQLRARIERTLEYMATAKAAEFEGGEDRDIVMPLRGDMVLEVKGLGFARDWTIPHFYFHVVTAYDILRHNGVELGKRDYLGHVASAIRSRPTARRPGTLATAAWTS